MRAHMAVHMFMNISADAWTDILAGNVDVGDSTVGGRSTHGHYVSSNGGVNASL